MQLPLSSTLSLAVKNSLAREGLRRILTEAGFEVVEGVDDLVDLARGLQTSGVHIFVIERSLAGNSIGGVIEGLLASAPNARIVIVADSFDLEDMVAVYSAGAYAYVQVAVPYQSFV